MRTVIEALGLAWRERLCRRVAIVSFVVLLALYATALPASFTNGQLGWVSLRMLTLQLAVIAVALASILSLTLALMTLILRQGQKAKGSAATGGALIGLITPLLCCSPVLPFALGGLAVLFPALAGAAAGTVQGFIATHELALLLFALALTGLALYQNARAAVEGARCRVA